MDETTTDYPRSVQIVTDAGYYSYLSIECESTRLPEPEGIRASKRMLDRVRDDNLDTPQRA